MQQNRKYYANKLKERAIVSVCEKLWKLFKCRLQIEKEQVSGNISLVDALVPCSVWYLIY